MGKANKNNNYILSKELIEELKSAWELSLVENDKECVILSYKSIVEKILNDIKKQEDANNNGLK